MKVYMRRVCRMVTVMAVIAAMLSACGSTTKVLQPLGFTGDGITQEDQVSAGLAEVDIVQDCCTVDTATGACSAFEPFTETVANARFTNAQGLDITIDHYEVEITDPDAGIPVRVRSAGNQVVTGKRCDSDPTRQCSTDDECAVGGVAGGSCRPSESLVHILLFDFSDKNLILPRAQPFGATLPVSVRFFGSDITGASWTVEMGYQARFDDFDNCAGG